MQYSTSTQYTGSPAVLTEMDMSIIVFTGTSQKSCLAERLLNQTMYQLITSVFTATSIL